VRYEVAHEVVEDRVVVVVVVVDVWIVLHVVVRILVVGKCIIASHTCIKRCETGQFKSALSQRQQQLRHNDLHKTGS